MSNATIICILQHQKKFPAFHGTWTSITVFKSTRHWDPILSQKNPFHIVRSSVLVYLLILFPHLRLTNQLTNSREPSPYWEATTSSATQKYPNMLWNPNVHYCLHNRLPFLQQPATGLHPEPDESSPIQSIPSHSIPLKSIVILSSRLRPGLLTGLFPSGFPTRTLCVFLISRMRVAYPAHLTLLDLVGPLSPRHGASSGCGWKRRPPDMEDSSEYIE
jgi:hypothetical protein